MTATRDLKLAELRAHLVAIGIDPDKHRDLQLIYATAAQQFDEASSRITSSSLLVKGPHETIVANPLLEIRDQAAATMDRIGRQLGLSPDHQPSRTLPDWDDWKRSAHR